VEGSGGNSKDYMAKEKKKVQPRVMGADQGGGGWINVHGEEGGNKQTSLHGVQGRKVGRNAERREIRKQRRRINHDRMGREGSSGKGSRLREPSKNTWGFTVNHPCREEKGRG